MDHLLKLLVALGNITVEDPSEGPDALRMAPLRFGASPSRTRGVVSHDCNISGNCNPYRSSSFTNSELQMVFLESKYIILISILMYENLN